MRIKRKNGLKVAAITIALLLCLALAVGITGAWYQAKRQATGTLSMDQGIIIDYKGFGQTPDEGIWTRETTTTFLLFDETNAQPGQNIPVNAAGIRANEKSVNFYARVKLSYKFYNNGTEVTTLPNASDLITTSANFFGTNWVDGGSSDGYYYYATGTTLNKFEKGTQTFVDLFAANAKFVIEGAGFTGATSDGEGGGFKVNDTTSINKIEIYLTLETLQGDATAEQAKALGWKIAAPVRFAEATGKMETSVGKTTVTGETLNVSVNNGTSDEINKVVFPYDKDTTLKFDSNNVEYISLTYSGGSTETFDAATYEVAENTFKVNAKSSKGTVTGYTVGLWNDSEYTGFTFSTKNSYLGDGDTWFYYDVADGIAVTGYFGNDQEINIASSQQVRNRNFKIKIEGYSNLDEWMQLVGEKFGAMTFPCRFNNKQCNSFQDMLNFIDSLGDLTDEEFITNYPSPMFITFNMLCEATSAIYSKRNIKEIGSNAFLNSLFTKVTIEEGVNFIGMRAFQECSNLSTINLPNTLVTISDQAFEACTELTIVNIPKNVETIGSAAFNSCSGLTTITIPDSVISIGASAFNSCSGLTSIIIPNSVTSIGASAFWNCSGLTSITIPDSVTSIGSSAFYGSGLASITVGSGVTSIGDRVFSYCSDLTSIVVDSRNNVYYSAGNCLIETASKTLIAGCKNSEIPSDGSVTSIGEYAFEGCSGLTSITIPSSVTSIGASAFYHCSKLATKISDIGGTWVKASDNTAVDPNTLLTDINYDIKRTA